MSENTNFRNSRSKPFTVDAKRLSAATLDRLRAIRRGEAEGVAVPRETQVSPFFLIGPAVIWFGLLLILTNGHLWSRFQIAIFAVISCAAAAALLTGLRRFRRRADAEARSYALITPLYYLETDRREISCRPLDGLIDAKVRHRRENGRHRYSDVTLTFEDGVRGLRLERAAPADEAVEKIEHWRKLLLEAAARGDAAYFARHELFGETEAREAGARPAAAARWLAVAVNFSAAAVVAAAVMLAAVSLNDYLADRRSWNEARATHRASAYRRYLQTHARGRWANEANTRLLALYDEAERKYRASLNDGADPAAVEAVVQILRYAKRTQNHRIKIFFSRINEIPADIVERLKADHETERIIGLDDTFSEPNLVRRESQLHGLLSDAFRQVIPDDIVEITGECAAECVQFAVEYRINSDSLYYDLRQKDVAEAERTYYPGIFIDWKFDVRIPDQSPVYSFSLTSNPAETISYDSVALDDALTTADFARVLEADKSFIYDSMATSAFEDFKSNLIYRMGIGEPPAENRGVEESSPVALKTES